jgi:hypothetical protein
MFSATQRYSKGPQDLTKKPEPSVPVSELHELIDAIIDLASAIRSLDKAKGE